MAVVEVAAVEATMEPAEPVSGRGSLALLEVVAVAVGKGFGGAAVRHTLVGERGVDRAESVGGRRASRPRARQRLGRRRRRRRGEGGRRAQLAQRPTPIR